MASTSTAVSTLVLALEAKNNTAAAFAELRGQLREQVDAARTAARESEEAARQGQARQLLDLRQTTAQELLELRQKTAYEAQAIRQSAAGQGAAALQAGRDKIMMLRQDAAQQDLIMRQSAQKAALAIRETTDAQIKASREQVEAVEAAARQEVEAMRTSQREQAEAARQAAAQERAAAREGAGGRRGVLGIGLPGMPGVGLLGSLGQMAWWNVGYSAINQITTAVGGFASGLVTTNAELEQLRMTFTAVYGSAAAGKAAVAWLDDFAQKVPATREQVMQAGLTIATLGDNVGQVLPALSNVSAVMGVDLPRAAQAFADAQMGRFEMLQMTLHVTKAELQAYGLQVDATGHVLNNSFVPAFERLAAARYGQGAALQMTTFEGKLSNVADALTRLQEIAGHGVFEVLKGSLDGLIKMLQSTDLQRWAAAVGDALGHMLQAAMHVASWMWTNLGPVVLTVINGIVLAWNAAAPLVGGAIRALEGVMAGIGTFLQTSVLPVVQNAIGQIVTWWNSHGKDMGKVWDDLQAGATKFWTWLGGAMSSTMTALQGAWTIAWGVMSGVVGVVIDVISGDWKKAKTDLLNIWKGIEVGVLQIVNGLVDGVIHAFHMLAGPIASVLNSIFVPTFKAVVDVGVELFTFLALKIEQAMQGMVGNVGASIVKLATKWGPLLSVLPGGHAAAAALYAAAAVSPTGKLTDKEIARRVQEAGHGAAEAAGRFIGPQPIPTFTFDDKKVTAGVDAWFAGVEQSIHYGPKEGFGEVGKTWWDSFTDAMKKHGIGKPELPKWLRDMLDVKLPPPPGAGFGAGAGGVGDLRSQSEAQQKAVQAAETRFQLDIARGTITQAQGLRDIAAILAARKAAGATPDELALTLLQDSKTLMEQLLGQAQKQFDFDAGVAHPSRQKLHQDELAYLKVLAQEPGITPLDVATQRQQMDARIAQLTGGTTKPKDLVTDATDRFKMDLLTLGRSTQDHARLVSDVNRIKADEVAAHYRGARVAYDFAENMKKVNEHMKTASAARQPVAPVPRYGALAGETGYGQTTVSFGGAQVNQTQQIVAALREQLAESRAQTAIERARAERDERIIALLETGNVTEAQQLAALRGIDHNIGHPPPPRSAHSVLRAAGSYTPVTR